VIISPKIEKIPSIGALVIIITKKSLAILERIRKRTLFIFHQSNSFIYLKN